MKPLNKKVSWGILTIFFTFDSIVSHIAVTQLHGRELNLVIAPIVEKYPVLYFLLIPAELLMIYTFVFVIRKLVFQFILKRKSINKDTQEKIILGGICIYWLIANSSMNLIYVLGLRLPINRVLHIWEALSLFAFILATLYGLRVLNSLENK